MSGPQVQLEPAEGNLVRAALVGICAWLLAAVVLLTQRDDLAARGTSWWVWTAVAGVLVGLVQLAIYVQRARLYGGARSTPMPAAGVGPDVEPPT